MAIASLRVPISPLPKADLSWLDSLATAGGDVMSELGARKSFGGLADRIGANPASAQPAGAGGFLSRLIGGEPAQPKQMAAVQPQQPMTTSVGKVDRGPAQGSTFEPFINTVRAGGVKNPNALAAIAATGKAESGWSPANANRSWSDPSVSGQPGTAGGVMSWRAERLQNLYNYAASKGESPGAISPETQAEYFLKEDPQLIARLNQAKSPQEAADIMAGAWRFAGYDQQGGEAGRRRALAQNYYSQFAGQEMEQGDTSGAEAAYVDPMVTSAAGAPQMAQGAPQGGQPQAPMQTADASGGMIAPGVTPVQRGGVDPATIQFMLRDPNLREAGVKLWAANAQGQNPAEPWQFVNLPDGTLARANQQTGAVERLGNFAKPPESKSLINVGNGNLFDPNTREVIDATGGRKQAPDLVDIYDEQTGQPYKARWNDQTGDFERVGGIKAGNGMAITTNPDGTVSITQGAGKPPKLTEAEGKNSGFLVRANESQKILNALEQEGTSLWNKTVGNVPVFGNFARSEDAQKYDQAKRDFINAQLRRESGAVISPEEFANAEQQYFPQPGDGPQVIEQKRQNRQNAIRGLEIGAGAGLDAASQPSVSQPAGAPQPGTIEEGYRFKGGNPSDPNSWEPAN